jgi:4a-hydroxytetrahydrobiopterin dehydratase
MGDLHNKKCSACNGDILKFNRSQIAEYLTKISNWQYQNDFIFKEYKFKNFADTLDFVNQIGEISESENHHPNINFTWGYCKISIQTHKISGVCENDFILASKIDKIR